MDFFSDRKLLLGIGIGIVIGIFSMLGVKYSPSMTQAQIEEKARGLGMTYPEDMKVINKDVKK
jgi:hypothetical protein